MKICQIIILNKYQIGANGIIIAGDGILVEFDHDGFQRKMFVKCLV